MKHSNQFKKLTEINNKENEHLLKSIIAKAEVCECILIYMECSNLNKSLFLLDFVNAFEVNQIETNLGYMFNYILAKCNNPEIITRVGEAYKKNIDQRIKASLLLNTNTKNGKSI